MRDDAKCGGNPRRLARTTLAACPQPPAVGSCCDTARQVRGDDRSGRMSKSIDYFYTHTSPWTYLGHARFLRIAAKHGASVTFKPSSFGTIFAQSGGLPLAKRAPQRQAYRMMELRRWRAFLGIELNRAPKHFPVPDEAVQRFGIAAGQMGLDMGTLSGALLRAVWAEERDVSDDATLAAIANEQGMDGAAVLKRSKEADIAARYEANTKEAMERNVFGAPTFIYKDELFWGQDRLDFLDRALEK
jgi:2-hydroxychromene-2-carboxylate isomerase